MTPRLSRTAVQALIAALALALAPGAFAASEQGDAGDLRASSQNLGGEAVTTISGTFTSGLDVDLYRLCLSNGSSFSASTVGGTALDTQMYLFDSDGLGVYANDDWRGARGSELPANHRFSPTRGGEYYLGISSFNIDPYSDQGEVFADGFSRTLYPDGVIDANGSGATRPLTSWRALRASGGPGPYTITVTGSSGCDTTPPTVDLRSPVDGARVGQGAPVEVDFSCADEGGSGLASCTGTIADGAQLDTSKLGQASVTVTARDGAGNQTVVTNTVTVVDETAPRITLDTPVDGATYALGEIVPADYACADEAGGSGVVRCAGTVADGAAVDTASIGEKTFTVEATDAAGNSASKSVTYSVVYDFHGFLWPVENPPALNRWKAGVPVPIRFSLDGFRGSSPEAPGFPRSSRCDGGDVEQVARGSKKSPVFHYQRGTDRYVMLWKTDRTWAGSCREFVLKLDDGSVHTARFQFVKRLNR